MKTLNKVLLVISLVSASLRYFFGVSIVAAFIIQAASFGIFILAISFTHALKIKNADHGIVKSYGARVSKFRRLE